MTQILRVGLLQEAQRVYVEACLQMCLGPGKRNHIVTHKIGLKDLCRVVSCLGLLHFLIDA